MGGLISYAAGTGVFRHAQIARFVFVPSMTDFTAVGETLGLMDFFELFSRVGQKCHLQQARLVTFEEIKQDNAILLGGSQS